MRYAIVTKIFHFESAHHLPGHRGKCAHLHGHSYRLEVSIRGPLKDMPGASDHGMVMDFSDLSSLVQHSVLERLDHRDLNEATGIHTTAENLVHWIWNELTQHGLPETFLYRLRLWETESGYVEITRSEREQMNVMEIYRSVQGEGLLMGVPTTFVRFFACNLRCSWCDTKYSWSVREGGTWESLAPEAIAEQIHELGARHVVLTGGEPMLQKDLAHLAQILKDQGHHLTVETNTTIFRAGTIPLIDLWSLSPKLPSAGEEYLNHPVIAQFLATLRSDQQQWKFVLRDDADEQRLRSLLLRYPLFAEKRLPIILQPEGDAATPDYPAALERLAERVRDPFWNAYAVRVLPQLHVIIWGRRRWV